MSKCKILLFVSLFLSILLTTSVYQATAQESKTTPAQTQAQPSDDAIWQKWVDWLPTAPSMDSLATAVTQFRASLIASGASAAEADREITVLRRLNHDRSDGWRLIFNNIYANSNPGFTTQPNALLVSAVEGCKPGRALDIGMGQGRNSVFLALKGWDVTGFDISDGGIEVARKNAGRAGVKIDAVASTDEAFDYGIEKWDLIVFVYNPLPVTAQAYVERLRKSLKPGGLVVIEGPGAEITQASRASTAIDPGLLLAVFKDFRLLRYEDTVAKSDWPVVGEEMTRVVRMVVEKRP